MNKKSPNLNNSWFRVYLNFFKKKILIFFNTLIKNFKRIHWEPPKKLREEFFWIILIIVFIAMFFYLILFILQKIH